MSRVAFRIVLFTVIGLIVVAGAFMSARAISAASNGDSLGMYVLGGSLSNPLQNQSSQESKPKLDTFSDPARPNEGGGDCESEGNSSDL